MNPIPSTQEMHKAILNRDSTFDGIFITAVKTTGIFCRPSCSARKPLAENVEFFGSVREALFSGYRPCKRCRPLHTNGSAPEWVGRLLEEVDADPAKRIKDGSLRDRGIDPARVRRYFLQHFGMTFQAYCRGRRMGKAFEQIRRGANVEDVALDHGYESSSGFREAFTQTYGQSPGKNRVGTQIVSAWMESPLGPLVAGATDKGICLLEFTDRRMIEKQLDTLRKCFDCAIVPGNHDHLSRLKEELAQYFVGKRKEFSLPLQYPGTPFQQIVWEELRRIPYGETRSYEEMAIRIGNPKAVRAVGTANGMNRIAIIIPCHRVVNKGGQLGGYGGGLWRKQFLLNLEREARPRKRLGENE